MTLKSKRKKKRTFRFVLLSSSKIDAIFGLASLE